VKYLSFIKLEHTLFSLPLLFAGALLAESKWPSLRISLLIVLAGASARVVAMTLNRIIDRHIDKKNPRTASRHLSAGKMKLMEAWLVALMGLAVYLLAAWVISDFCLKMSWIPLLGFVAYPYFKRFTKWTHVGLGLVWSLVPLAGFWAVKPNSDEIGALLLLAIFSVFWLAGFDIIYATQDAEFDHKEGVHSLPGAWGSERALRVAALFHLISFAMLILLYAVWFSGPLTLILLVIAGILLFMEQLMSDHVDVAFFRINAIIGFVVLFFVWAGVKGV
jgi:4-hydroxybenzoate polyprenyltransferase